jgi:cytochrome c oxidase assembly protein subunit 15
LVAAAVLVLGTVVTGAGPHSGDAGEVKRFGFDVATVAQVHADAAMLLVGLSAALVFAVRLAGATVQVRRTSTLLVAAVLAQAAIGFTQYFTGVPVGLVELHIAGATTIWIITLRLWLAAAERPDVRGPEPTPGPTHASSPAASSPSATATAPPGGFADLSANWKVL